MKTINSIRLRRIKLKTNIASDSRVKELLEALNEKILSRDTVYNEIISIIGTPIHFYQYRDGTYYICE